MSTEHKAGASAGALPGQPRGVFPALGRALPSGRSLAIGFAVLAAALGGYAAARQTSLFAVSEIQVRGAPPVATSRVESALASLTGESLLAVEASDVDRALAGLPDVRALSLDRAFPHTLVVTVTAERPAAVLRRGSEAWLVSERGRVLHVLTGKPPAELPRLWVANMDTPRDGALVEEDTALQPALALGGVLTADQQFLRRIREARAVGPDTQLVLRSGVEVRLGSLDDLALKIAVAREILSVLPDATMGYVDVSVPERPVARTDSQVSR